MAKKPTVDDDYEVVGEPDYTPLFNRLFDWIKNIGVTVFVITCVVAGILGIRACVNSMPAEPPQKPYLMVKQEPYCWPDGQCFAVGARSTDDLPFKCPVSGELARMYHPGENSAIPGIDFSKCEGIQK